ncbi:hypothetical protein YS110_01260 [Acidovorax sp. YS12]|nr:hypothetical protein YS110_01260 [Acidovorax sp. YS12]
MAVESISFTTTSAQSVPQSAAERENPRRAGSSPQQAPESSQSSTVRISQQAQELAARDAERVDSARMQEQEAVQQMALLNGQVRRAYGAD